MNSGAPGSEPSIVPPAVRAAWTRVVSLARGLSRPARVLIGATTATAVLVALWLGLRGQYEPYGVLFSQLDREDAGAIVAKLKELHIPYRVSAEGGSIEVPEPRVPEVRLELGAAGLPRSGGVGFESFDTMRLGATEFEQRVLYRRAMEGELARTIGGIDAIRSVRVHLVMPERSVFAARREPASASVTVRLRPGRTLGSSEVNGIVHIISAAVPGLSSDQVALVTTEGLALHHPRRPGAADAPGGGGGVGDSETPPARALEASIEERARAMLEKVVGAGHVDVRVSADVDLAHVERTEDHYDSGSAVLRSEEATTERTAGGADDSVAGIPGAESNLPAAKGAASAAASAAPAPAAGGPITRETHTRNFEVDHVQEKHVSSSGIVRRLTVAVVVDGAPGPDGHTLVPRERAELDKLEKLVKSASGFVEKRGDVVTVESALFPDADPIAAVAPPPVSVIASLPPKVRRYLPIGAGALGLVLAVVLLVRRRRSRRKAAALLLAAAAKPLEIAPTTPALELTAATRTTEDLREEVVRRVKADPASAALVLRHWLDAGAPPKSVAPVAS
jgi:flagellar M-ring protein FliF